MVVYLRSSGPDKARLCAIAFKQDILRCAFKASDEPIDRHPKLSASANLPKILKYL